MNACQNRGKKMQRERKDKTQKTNIGKPEEGGLNRRQKMDPK